jgi:hypothetical protein
LSERSYGTDEQNRNRDSCFFHLSMIMRYRNG